VSEAQDAQRCDFFVSYTGADTAWAEWIAWQLKTAGYAVISQAYLGQSTYGSDEWTGADTHDDPAQSGLLLVLVRKDDQA
jgi:cephalosporin-C deacetylase-like acetyl esterase